METNYGRRILSTLLDWYENSPAYVRGEKPARRRIMRLYDGGQTDFPEYNIEDPIIRRDVNQAVLDLAGKRFVDYEWMRGQQNHIMAKVSLIAGSIELAFKWLDRQPKRDAADELLLRLSQILIQTHTPWAKQWLEDTIKAIIRKHSITPAMPTVPSERDDLLKAISFLADNTELETLERVFSMRCYGDSKHFERYVKARLARVLRKYLAHDDCTDEEAFKLVGIVSYPEQFAFSGALSIIFPSAALDFAALPFGGTLNINDLMQGRIVLGQDVQKVLTIENRANYIDYIYKQQKKGELVIFHGGHFSPAKCVFLQTIAAAASENSAFYHWGDLDYGGYLMLARLRREIKPDVHPWKMDQNELLRYSEFTAGFSESYRKRLVALLNLPELSDCYSCIEYMIESGVRLEQEAMLT